MHALTQDQVNAVGGGLTFWGWLGVVGAAIDFADGFNDAYNAAHAAK
jgi:hypothetical protein